MTMHSASLLYTICLISSQLVHLKVFLCSSADRCSTVPMFGIFGGQVAAWRTILHAVTILPLVLNPALLGACSILSQVMVKSHIPFF